MGRGNQKKQAKGSSGYNRKNSEDFLIKNGNKPDVCTTDTGLQYLVIDAGAGESPDKNSAVEVQQRISLVDGSVIDDTYKSGDPARFSMAEAISGYREGLLMMKTGGRYRFYIHPDLAWGKRGAGKKIGPNAVLIIDARLVRIL